MARDAHCRAAVRALASVAFAASFVLGGAFAPISMIGCADAPITPDQLEADGQLARPGGGQSAFAADRGTPRRASVVKIDAVLATAPTGAIEDMSTFPPDVGTVHLHVRADGLGSERDVAFRWTHGEHTLVVPGGLVPTSQYVLAASIDVQPDQTGRWLVEVVTKPPRPGEAPEVLFSREFVILSERPSE